MPTTSARRLGRRGWPLAVRGVASTILRIKLDGCASETESDTHRGEERHLPGTSPSSTSAEFELGSRARAKARRPPVSDGEAKGKGILIAWIGAAVGIVSAVGVLYGILHHPDTSVTDYQKQVQATCVRTHRILAADHSEIFQFNPSFEATSPSEGFIVDKAALVRVANDSMESVKQDSEFSTNRPSQRHSERRRRCWIKQSAATNLHSKRSFNSSRPMCGMG
jgi:hypothetical protein